MREIKFRGKEINTNEWVYGFYIQGSFIDPNTGKETIRHIIHADFLHDVQPETIGQYTGMHDKNGKEIYEGDTVLVSDWTSVYASDYSGTVCFRRGQWVVSYEKYGGDMTPRLFFDDFSDRKTTITGNIHELKKEL